MSNYIILSPDDILNINAEQFRDAAQARWPGALRFVMNPDSWEYDIVIHVESEPENGFQILHNRTGESIATDGTPEQSAHVALWVRSVLPHQLCGRVWMTDQGFSGHVELRPGMTTEEVWTNWIDHNEHPPVVV